MVSVCMYFQVHQPYRLARYQFFNIGTGRSYFDAEKNKALLLRVAKKCYLPTNKILLELMEKHPGFKVSFSLSGVVLDQFEEYCPDVLESFTGLVGTGKVELLSETYHHSLACVYSPEEFVEQVKLHRKKIQSVFGRRPTVLRNTELIYSNALAAMAEEMGYTTMLLEGADKVLGWKSPDFVYSPVNAKIRLLLKNYRLSDDVAFRFSERSWKEWPLTIEKYARWIHNINGNGVTCNLFMDYETFGEHQWETTGIFEFLKRLPGELLKHPDNNFRFPSEVAYDNKPVGELDIPDFLSWADIERDLSAWLGNDMQKSAIKTLYALEKDIKRSGDEKLLNDWRRLQTSDHFYYMCTKWFNDGDVHKYFNPYDSPYDAFIAYMNIIKDMQQRTAHSKKLEQHITEVKR